MQEFSKIENAIKTRMAGQPAGIIEDFTEKAKLVHAGATGKADWANIGDLREDDQVKLADLTETDQALYSKLVLVKLNGGLGTSMGLSKAKSLIGIRKDKTFFDVILEQLQVIRERTGKKIPLLFMNSFNTQADTLNYPGIAKLNDDLPSDFLQNMVPRLDAGTLEPLEINGIEDTSHPDLWCPPGHGDIFLSLKETGLLDKLIEQGYEYAFLSNGDNLGAVVDGRIITMMARQSIDFAMEVTPKTKADIKGGVLYREKNGAQRIQLLETAQVPEGHMPDFEDINRFEFFSINNLWVRLPALKERLRQGPLSLSLIVNPKEVGGKKVLQLECAMGSGIGQFDKTKVIEVPRSRFAPVKKCDDLLVRRSDAYILDENKALVKNPQGRGAEPVVKLSDDYKKVADFERLVQEIPSILELEELVVEGPVLFDIPVTLKGKVKFIAQNGTAKISKLGKTSFENETLQL